MSYYPKNESFEWKRKMEARRKRRNPGGPSTAYEFDHAMERRSRWHTLPPRGR